MRVRECRLSLCLTSVAVKQHWCRDQHLASLVFRSGPEGLPMTAPHFLARLARSVFVTLLPIAFLLSCSTTPTQTGPTAAERAKTIIANPIRTDQDRRMDESRNPAEFLPFTGVKPGMMVLDVSAGARYTSQLLALSVAPDRKLWAQREPPGAARPHRLGDKPHPQ